MINKTKAQAQSNQQLDVDQPPQINSNASPNPDIKKTGFTTKPFTVKKGAIKKVDAPPKDELTESYTNQNMGQMEHEMYEKQERLERQERERQER